MIECVAEGSSSDDGDADYDDLKIRGLKKMFVVGWKLIY